MHPKFQICLRKVIAQLLPQLPRFLDVKLFARAFPRIVRVAPLCLYPYKEGGRVPLRSTVARSVHRLHRVDVSLRSACVVSLLFRLRGTFGSREDLRPVRARQDRAPSHRQLLLRLRATGVVVGPNAPTVVPFGESVPAAGVGYSRGPGAVGGQAVAGHSVRTWQPMSLMGSKRPRADAESSYSNRNL